MCGCPQPPVHHWPTTGLPWCVVALNHQFTIGQPRVYHDVWLPSTTSSPMGNQGQPRVYHDVRLSSTISSPLGNHGSTMVHGWPQPPVHHWATMGLPWCMVDLNHQFTTGQPRVYHDVWLPSTTSSSMGNQGQPRVYHGAWLTSTTSSSMGKVYHGARLT